jgi:hypothetical protein
MSRVYEEGSGGRTETLLLNTIFAADYAFGFPKFFYLPVPSFPEFLELLSFDFLYLLLNGFLL